jgi:hypothetical protein
LFVSPDGDDLAEGSAERPFATVRRAIASARREDVVVLSKGDFAEPIDIPNGVRIVGACAAETRLSAPPNTSNVVVAFTGSGTLEDVGVVAARTGITVAGADVVARLRGISIRGGAGWGLYVSRAAHVDAVGLKVEDFEQIGASSGPGVELVESASAMLEAVVVRRTQAAGIRATRASFELDRAWVTEVRLANDRPTAGLVVGDAVTATVSRTWLSRNRQAGITAASDAQLTLRDGLISDTELFIAENNISSSGIIALENANVRLKRVGFVRNIGQAIGGGLGARIDAEDVLVIDTAPDITVTLRGSALNFIDGSAVVRRFAAVRSTRGAAQIAGGTLEAEDLTIVETRGLPIQNVQSFGILANAGAQVHIDRALLRDNRGLGLAAEDAETFVRASDIVVRDTVRDASGQRAGVGVLVGNNARIELDHARVVGAHLNGLQSVLGGELSISDSVVEDVLSTLRSEDGLGALVVSGALRAERTEFTGLLGLGIETRGANARLELTDVVVEDVLTNQSGRSAGGIAITSDAEAEFNRVEIRRVPNFGLAVEASRLAGSDVTIRDVRPAGDRRKPPVGLVASYEADVTVERGEIREIGGLGMFVGVGARASVTDVIVRDITADLGLGDGIQIASPASFGGRRLALANFRRAGIFVSGREAMATVDAVRVEDPDPSPLVEDAVAGVVVQEGAAAQVTDLRSRDLTGTGVLLRGRGSAVSLRRFVVTGLRSGCGLEAGCTLPGAGHAALASGPVDLAVDGFVVDGAGAAAFRLEGGARLAAKDGEISAFDAVVSRDVVTSSGTLSALTVGFGTLSTRTQSSTAPPSLSTFEPEVIADSARTIPD